MPLRTPDKDFQNLPGFPFQSNYIQNLAEYEDMRIHYLDEGPRDSKNTFLCLHGEPTWSYLYRKMIPIFSQNHIRTIAPDLIGFGRSDKLADDKDYSFDFHRDMLVRFIEKLDLKNITLVCQDWGGVLGLTIPLEMPHRFSGLLVMNTMLATGDVPLTKGFLEWRDYVRSTPNLNIAKLMKRACPHLTEEECAAYSAPYPDSSFKAGVRTFPNLVPEKLDSPGALISRKARDWWKNEWNGKSFMAIGMADPVLGPKAMAMLKTYIRNCPPPMELSDAGHFVQEWGDTIAKESLKSFGLLNA